MRSADRCPTFETPPNRPRYHGLSESWLKPLVGNQQQESPKEKVPFLPPLSDIFLQSILSQSEFTVSLPSTSRIWLVVQRSICRDPTVRQLRSLVASITSCIIQQVRPKYTGVNYTTETYRCIRQNNPSTGRRLCVRANSLEPNCQPYSISLHKSLLAGISRLLKRLVSPEPTLWSKH